MRLQVFSIYTDYKKQKKVTKNKNSNKAPRMALIVQCIPHKDKTYVNAASSVTVRVSLPTFFLLMFSLASFHLLPLYFWHFYNYGTSFMVVTAPAFFARKKVLHIT